MHRNVGALSNLLGRDLLVIVILILLLFVGIRRTPELIRAIRKIPAAFRRGLNEQETDNTESHSNTPGSKDDPT